MRLIDADALPVSIWLDGDGNSQKAIKYADLKAAPTVCCEECRWRHAPTGQGYCYIRHQAQGDWQRTDEQMEDFGCAYFERREP